MNDLKILTTNMGALCSYAFIRSLKDKASKIVLLYQQDKPTIIALSKYVHKSYKVSFPQNQWESGDLSKENNGEEEAYINNILKICKVENINVIIPTCDREVYVFSKNKERFECLGIIVLVSNYEAILNSADKHKLILAASMVGFPHPTSFLPSSLSEAEVMADNLGYPVIIKSRTGAGAAGVRIVHEKSRLLETVEEIKKKYGWPMIQEYIHGNREPSINIILDNQGNPVLHYSLRKLRYVAASRSTCVEVIEPLPETAKAIELVQFLGLKGFIAIQTKYDEKDNVHKIIEINARWGGNSAICLSIGEKVGLNAMLLNIQAMVNKSGNLPLQTLQPGMVGVSMIEDFLAIKKYFTMKLSRTTKRIDNPLPSFITLLRSYWETYTTKNRTVDYFTKALIDDPKMAISVYKRLIPMALKDNGVFVPWGEINHRIIQNEKK